MTTPTLRRALIADCVLTPEQLETLAAEAGCNYWSLDDCPDELAHQTLSEALGIPGFRSADHFARWLDQRRSEGGLVLHGWTRKVVTQRDIDSMVEHLTDEFHEYWCEFLELGNPEDGDERVIEPPGLRALVEADMRKRHVYQCDETDRMAIRVEEVVAFARRDRPELVGERGQRVWP